LNGIMKNSIIAEIIVSVILILLLLFLLNPFDLGMPQPVQITMMIGLGVLFIAFVVFVWKEKVADERERLHRHISARAAYLAGTAVLVIGVIVQSASHILDPWLVIALAAMILGKIIGLIYSKVTH